MSKLATAARLLMGTAFVVFGLNGFLHFLPDPGLPERARIVITSFVQTGYLMQVVKATEVVGGALLLTGIAVPLALVLLAPIVVNIFLFHLMLAPEGLGPAIVLGACELVLARAHWSRFHGLFA